MGACRSEVLLISCSSAIPGFDRDCSPSPSPSRRSSYKNFSLKAFAPPYAHIRYCCNLAVGTLPLDEHAISIGIWRHSPLIAGHQRRRHAQYRSTGLSGSQITAIQTICCWAWPGSPEMVRAYDSRLHAKARLRSLADNVTVFYKGSG